MEADIVRITAHPDDPRIVLLHVPHGRNDLMGRYEPAQLDTDHRAYLLLAEHLESFERFATYAGLYLLDERTLTPVQISRRQLCNTCNKPQRVCQTAAGNTGSLRDHDFMSVAEADTKRATPTLPEA